MEVGFAFDDEGVELASGGKGVEDVSDAGAGGERGEKGFDLVFGAEDGLSEVERDQGGEGGGLAGVGSGFDLFGEPCADRFPKCGGAAGLEDGKDAEVLPELRQGAEDRCFGDLLAEVGDEVIGRARAIFGEQGVGVEGKWRDLGRARVGGRLLPGFVAAQGEDVGQDLARDEEVRAIGRGGRGRRGG